MHLNPLTAKTTRCRRSPATAQKGPQWAQKTIV